MNTTLWNLNKNEQGIINGFHSQLSSSYIKRLNEFGFEKVSKVLCVKEGSLRSYKIFQVRDSVFCLDKDLALKVHINKMASGI